MNLLKGGVAVVTGGAGREAGLGQELVRAFAREGMSVAILDIDGVSAAQLASSLQADGVSAISIACDVRDENSLAAAAAEVQERFGACNVLCAHVGGGALGPIDQITLEAWRDTFDFITATMGTVLAFLPLMRKSDGARRIVLTSSVAAMSAGGYMAGYRAGKAALTSIGETLDVELGPEGIGTTIAFPGVMFPEHAIAKTEGGEGLAPAVVPDSMREIVDSMTKELWPVPADNSPASLAALPIVNAVSMGKRYVFTHGKTVVRNYNARHEQIHEALALLS